ncbi:MAG TPA: NAD(P)H-hydrate dehydratase, partial [Candidatus Saccharimonadia bacterium]|nr:NAD(P)H-hydrate dehydratase [Candidatus Saccharimonadia bacterium]
MSRAKLLTRAALRARPLPDPCRSESKEDRGRVLVVGGGREVPGSVVLAA